MKAYVIIKGGKFDTLMFDPDEVIRYFNENKDSDLILEVKTFDVPKDKDNFITKPNKDDDTIDIITPNPYVAPPYNYIQKPCKSWSDCTNPHRDCFNCPVRDAGSYSIPTMKEFEHFGQSILNDTVKVTCTNDTINKQ